MKKYILASVAVIAVLALTLGLYAQPAGGGGRGAGGGGFGGGAGGGMGGFGGGARGMRGMATERPSKADRLAAVKELETQIAALKTAIDKAPANDPNISTLEGDALTAFMDVYTPESEAINAIQRTLTSLRGSGGRGGRGGFGGGASEDVLSELRVLADGEKAKKTVARLDALIKDAQDRASRRGAGRGAGGGRGGAGGMGGFGGGGGFGG